MGLFLLAAAAAILARMEQVMGPLPPAAREPLDVRVEEETRLERYTLRKITFVSEGSDRVPAYLLLPHQPPHQPLQQRPALLCLHQTTRAGKAEPAGLTGKLNLHYARELAERGYVALAPDYPNYGDYKVDAYAMGYVSATMKGIVNHRRAVDVLSSMPEVDRRRIGAIGHSLGGHNALFVAAFDLRIRAVVTSCGFTSFARYYKGDLKGWSHKGYMPRILEVYGAKPDRMPFDFNDVLDAIAPRPVFINAPLHDGNFDPVGVDESVQRSRNKKLVVRHPDAGHDFPPDIREEAYRFVDRTLVRR
jgi:fermentation-respiration switch protein FrsA (DUF1100 family)